MSHHYVVLLEGFLKYRLLDPTPEIFIIEVSSRGPSICVSNKFPNDADDAGL